MTEAAKPDPVFVAELAREVSRIVRQRTGRCLGKEGKRELRKMFSSGLTLKGVSSNDLRAQGWTIMQASDVGKIAQGIVDEMLERSEGEWTPSSSSSILALLRASADCRFCVGPVEPDPPRFKIACRVDDTIHFARITRASCFWVYAYPALLRYAATHSAGGYWARILPQASEIAS
jgi:hypothetical protein